MLSDRELLNNAIRERDTAAGLVIEYGHLLRFAVEVMRHGNDKMLVEACDFITAKLQGSDRELSPTLGPLWNETDDTLV